MDGKGHILTTVASVIAAIRLMALCVIEIKNREDVRSLYPNGFNPGPDGDLAEVQAREARAREATVNLVYDQDRGGGGGE
jgi:hypothetical protein